jgi:hypothetical protein
VRVDLGLFALRFGVLLLLRGVPLLLGVLALFLVPVVAFDGVDVIDQRQRLAAGAGVLDRLVEPLVQVAARAHDQVRVSERLDVVGAQLVVVRVRVRRDQAGDVGVVAGHLAREIRGLGRRGHHGEAAPAAGGTLRRRVVAAPGSDNRDGAEQGEGSEAERRHARRY